MGRELLPGANGGGVQHPLDVAPDHIQAPREARPVLGKVGRTVSVLGVGQQVADVGVYSGEQGQEGLTVHREHMTLQTIPALES